MYSGLLESYRQESLSGLEQNSVEMALQDRVCHPWSRQYSDHHGIAKPQILNFLKRFSLNLYRSMHPRSWLLHRASKGLAEILSAQL